MFGFFQLVEHAEEVGEHDVIFGVVAVEFDGGLQFDFGLMPGAHVARQRAAIEGVMARLFGRESRGLAEQRDGG